MTSRNLAASEIIDHARAWIGTPFRHQGRRRGVGVDCIGVIISVAHELGITNYDRTNYGRRAHDRELEWALDWLFPRLDGKPVPGAILLFQFAAFPQHVGIMTDYGFVHAHGSVKRCVEIPFAAKWRSRFVRAYWWHN